MFYFLFLFLILYVTLVKFTAGHTRPVLRAETGEVFYEASKCLPFWNEHQFFDRFIPILVVPTALCEV